MVDLLEVRALRERVAPISVAHYEGMGERPYGQRTELIRGLVIEKMTISPLHSFLVARLHRLIQAALAEGTSCRQEQPLKLRDSVPEPDLAVVPGQEADYRPAHPTTAQYWIILANQERIRVHTGLENGLYTQSRLYNRGETAVCGVPPELRVELDALFSA